jgi:hypothetical protein
MYVAAGTSYWPSAGCVLCCVRRRLRLLVMMCLLWCWRCAVATLAAGAGVAGAAAAATAATGHPAVTAYRGKKNHGIARRHIPRFLAAKAKPNPRVLACNRPLRRPVTRRAPGPPWQKKDKFRRSAFSRQKRICKIYPIQLPLRERCPVLPCLPSYVSPASPLTTSAYNTKPATLAST